jgi:hypothetical protein
MSESQKILAFDIGIRNLAWCLLDIPQPPLLPLQVIPEILGWQNYDLLTGQGHEQAPKKLTCCKCSVRAAFTNPIDSGPTCLKHCPPTHPPLKDLSGVVFKKIPDAKTIRKLAPTVRAGTKAAMITSLRLLHSLPYEVPKVKKALDTELTTLHNAIQEFVVTNLEKFRQATHILLENQPVLKNPTMKTVQILLFATLRDMIQPDPPPLKLVHAGKKITGMETGDAGYKSRKDASEAKVLGLLQSGKVVDAPKWLGVYKGHTKKSDLADALCMCWDRVPMPQPTA